jgi:hypothetical protein
MSGYDDRYDRLYDAVNDRPIALDPINEAVRDKIKTRAELGMKKYGVSIMRNDIDLLGWLNHLQEELMDACVYIERSMHEIRSKQDDHR